jgi:hypothetical protein
LACSANVWACFSNFSISSTDVPVLESMKRTHNRPQNIWDKSPSSHFNVALWRKIVWFKYHALDFECQYNTCGCWVTLYFCQEDNSISGGSGFQKSQYILWTIVVFCEFINCWVSSLPPSYELIKRSHWMGYTN